MKSTYHYPNLDSLIVRSDVSIRECLQKIEISKIKLVFVVDDHHVLKGSVSDGDVRRWLISGNSLDVSVTSVMNVSCLKGSEELSREDMLLLMRLNDIVALPIVDSESRIIRIERKNSIPDHDSSALIMAGGFGKRLGAITKDVPKPLLRVGDKSLLERLISQLVDFGFKRFYISIHYMSDMIVDFLGDGNRLGIEIHYIREDQPLGTAGCLAFLPDSDSCQDLLVVNSDIVTDLDFFDLREYHINEQADLTVVGRRYEYAVQYGVLMLDQSDNFKEIVQKPVYEYLVNAGIYFLKKSVAQLVEKGVVTDMTDLVKDLTNKKGAVCVYKSDFSWVDVGSRETLSEVRRKYGNE